LQRFNLTLHRNVARAGERRSIYIGVRWGNLTERDHFEDQGVDGRIILRWIFRRWEGGMVWIDLAQEKDRWRALVNAVMELRVP